MTTIAYRDGIMAAEGKMTLGDMVIKLDTEKVFWVNNHLVGVCGRARAINTFVSWLQKQTDYHIVNSEVGDLVDLIPPVLEDDEGYTALVVTPSRQVLMYEGNTPIDMGVDVPMSVGSGSCFALAAMKAGNSAEEAVKVACELDVYSGGEITVVQLEEEPQPLTREVAENLSKDELINMMFGEEQAENTISVMEDDNLNLKCVHQYSEFIILWKQPETDKFIFEVNGMEFDVDETLTSVYFIMEGNFSVEELKDICYNMDVPYSLSNTRVQLATKLIQEVKFKTEKCKVEQQ